MTHLVGGFSALLLASSFAFAQSPAPAPPAAAAKPAVTSAESPEIRDFQKIENAWADAINARDQYALELVL